MLYELFVGWKEMVTKASTASPEVRLRGELLHLRGALSISSGIDFRPDDLALLRKRRC